MSITNYTRERKTRSLSRKLTAVLSLPLLFVFCSYLSPASMASGPAEAATFSVSHCLPDLLLRDESEL
ncbi:MAG: hypothetical protein HOF74_08355 [Gammaproteobacteria bacterium]|nr:hypothetical protein [Gammaproteobacteria bacterium]MBT3859826.1 hypothetical protein [Gammaproteobacteria bacterium]MBT3988844.1 hypothetical protein [Gammaproteobacteria bacterium]MBT4254656.1 hypothetical protein [Gammaproteobacteria bacterium]MBT4580878.1 hypothetical protein [Gammaproteobacteria bacterium]